MFFPRLVDCFLDGLIVRKGSSPSFQPVAFIFQLSSDLEQSTLLG